MTKFYGVIGFAGDQVETVPGVFADTLVEFSYYGDVVRNTIAQREAEKVNDDLSVGNSISIVADAWARENITKMRYIQWAGDLWKISDVEVQVPRLLLRLGGVYNGPTAPASDPS